MLILPMLVLFDDLPTRISPQGIAAALIAGVILTGLLFQIGFAILPRAGATKVSTLTFVAPITALVLGAILLGERLAPEHYIGMLVIFAGLLLIDGSLFRRVLKTE